MTADEAIRAASLVEAAREIGAMETLEGGGSGIADLHVDFVTAWEVLGAVEQIVRSELFKLGVFPPEASP